jgi:hypothetical protein
MPAISRPLLICAALLAYLPSGSSLAQLNGESWIPIVVLSENQQVPLRAKPEGPVVLGFARADDLKNGLPLQIGWYMLDPAQAMSSIAQSYSSHPLAYRKGIELSAETIVAEVQAVCAQSVAPVDPRRCLDQVGIELGVGANYRFGDSLLSLGVSRAQGSASGQSWRFQPDFGTRVVTRDSISLRGSKQSNWGEFGVGLSLSEIDLGSFFGEKIHEGQLSVSWLYGNFGTALTGRVNQRSNNSDPWGGIDLGLIWRTPWNGLLTVGAQNALRSGQPDANRQPQVPQASNERVPYVRYEQDL